MVAGLCLSDRYWVLDLCGRGGDGGDDCARDHFGAGGEGGAGESGGEFEERISRSAALGLHSE